MDVCVISPDLYTYGAMLIGGIVRSEGHEVRLDTKFSSDVSGPARAILLSLYSTQHLLDPRIRDFVRSCRSSGQKCYIGGPVSAYPDMVLGELAPDAVVLGEGEPTVVPLIENGITPSLTGIAFRNEPGGEPEIRPGTPPRDIEHPLPFIPRDIGSQSIRGANVYIETHRGCTGGCTFCQVPRFFGRSIRSREVSAIVREVKAFQDAGARRISISGGTGSLYCHAGSGINTEAFVNLLAGIAGVAGPRNVSSPDIRADCINDEVLEAIRNHTIGWVFFGVESGSNRILRDMGKGIRIEQVADAIGQCRQHGLKVAGSFIVGYPTETLDDYEATKDFISAQQLDDVFVSVAEPIPSTPLAALALKTPRGKNPLYIPTQGEYRALKLTESEARCFDLMMHADMCKPGLHVVTSQVYDTYLGEARKQGNEIRAVTELIHRYHG